MTYEKLKHFIISKATEKNSVKEIKMRFKTGEQIVSSFLKAQSQSFTTEEKQSLEELDHYRDELSNRQDFVDFSLFGISEKQQVFDVYKRAASKLKWCYFFYFLSRGNEKKNILEIGTNLGVSGQYFIGALSDNKVEGAHFVTFEGVSDLCAIANKRFSKVAEKSICNYRIVEGLYENTLNEVENIGIKYDILFIDGNHKYQPTIAYYEYLLKHTKNNVIFIFDDINWSDEMKKAWQYILKSDYSYSIDFFKVGLIIIEKENYQRKNYNLFLTF